MGDIYGIDAEWSANHELVVAFAYNVRTRRYTRITPDMEPVTLDGKAYYYIAFDDVALTCPHVTFTEGYGDTNILAGLVHNASAYKSPEADRIGAAPKLRKRSMADLQFRMVETMEGYELSNLTKTFPKLELHCREDAYVSGALAEHYLKLLHNDQMRRDMAVSMQRFAEPWYKLTQTPIRMDIPYIKKVLDRDVLLATAERKGIDFYSVDEETGKIHQDLYKTQTWLENNSMSFRVSSRASYAKGGVARKWAEDYFKAITDPEDMNNEYNLKSIVDKNMDSEVRLLATLIYLICLKRKSDRDFQEWQTHGEVLCGQATGRFSPKGSPLAQGSILRAAVIPPEGMMTVSLDIKAQEPHLCAEFSGDKVLQSHLLEDVDLYSAVYAVVTAQDYVKLKKNDLNRNVAKNGITLPYFYGVGPETMADKLGVSGQAAKMIIAHLQENYSTFEAFRQRMIRHFASQQLATSVYHGWPLRVDWETQNPRQTFNHMIQGSGADMLRDWAADLLGAGYKVFHTLHDGLYIYMPDNGDQYKKDNGDWTSPAVEEVIDRSIKLMDRKFPLSWRSWMIDGALFFRNDENPNGRLYEKKDDYKNVEALLMEVVK